MCHRRKNSCSAPSEKPEDLVKSWPSSSINLMDHSDPTVAWHCKVYLLDSGCWWVGVLPRVPGQKMSVCFSPLEFLQISQGISSHSLKQLWECTQQDEILSERLLRNNSRSLRVSWVIRSLEEAAKGPVCFVKLSLSSTCWIGQAASFLSGLFVLHDPSSLSSWPLYS